MRNMTNKNSFYNSESVFYHYAEKQVRPQLERNVNKKKDVYNILSWSLITVVDIR